MSETSALASRRAFWLGSLARKGLIGRRAAVAFAGGVGVEGVEKAADNPTDPLDGLVAAGTEPPADTVVVAIAAVPVAVFAAGAASPLRGGGGRGAPNDGPTGGVRSARGATSGVETGAGVGIDGGVAPDGVLDNGGVRRAANGGVRGRAAAGTCAGTPPVATPGTAGARAGDGWRGRGAAAGAAGRALSAGVDDGRSLGRVASGPVWGRVGSAGAGVGCTLGEPFRGAPGASASLQPALAPTGMIPPQTEQRARSDTLVILAGSTRNTERHSGQETFIDPRRRARAALMVQGPATPAASRVPGDGRWHTPSRVGTSRTPSSPSQVRSPEMGL